MIAILGSAALNVGPAVADGDALVLVNGKPVPRAQVVDLAMQAHGLAVMQQVIVLELARQESARRGFKVTEADVQAEFQQSLERISPPVDAQGKPVDDASRRQALDLLLEQKGLSMAEFMIGMERNAHLRKLVERDLKINDETLREEFARTYGERVRVRHIQVDDANALRVVTDALNRGTDFAEAARQYSRHPDTAAKGGEMPPFTFDDAQIPPVLREAAFSMKPGEVSSPIRVERVFHILKLEERIAPETKRFEDERTTVEARLRERVVPQEMSRLATELFRKADIKVLDPKLKQQYEELLKRSAGGLGP